MNATAATRPAQAAPADVDQGGEAAVRRFVTVLAVVVGGLCFLFSLGNVYQLAVDLELWVWIRPLVAPAVDLSLVALVVGIRFLARRGVTGRELRRPRVFMLAVGLAAWALNTAGAVAERDWGKAAFDSLAPGLLIGWAEVLPWFLRQFQAVTHPAVGADPDQPIPGATASQPAGDDGMASAPGEPVAPAVPVDAAAVVRAVAAAPTSNGNGNRTRRASTGAGAKSTATAAAASGTAGGNDEGAADARMRAFWAVARAAGRTPSGAELDRVCGRDPRNGTGRKARARYLREEAAGRFWAPRPVPGTEAGAGGPVPAVDPAGAGPVPASAPGGTGPAPGAAEASAVPAAPGLGR